jgi:hypothetical protein
MAGLYSAFPIWTTSSNFEFDINVVMRAWLIGLLLLPFQQPSQPYYDFARAGAGFYGAGREAPDPDDLDAVRRVDLQGLRRVNDSLSSRCW